MSTWAAEKELHGKEGGAWWGQSGSVFPGANPVKTSCTVKINQKQLTAFNRSQGGTIRNAPSFNEAVNKERGLPGPDARQWLRSLYADKFGVMGGNLTMADVKGAVK